MRRSGLWTFPVTICLASVLSLAGCSSTPKDETQGWSPERIYKEARDEVSTGAWDKAIGLFEKLEGRAAGTVLAQQAQIEKAFAQYRNGDRFQAILDVTIVYPDGRPTFWHFLQGRMRRVTVRARLLPVPRDLALDRYGSDPAVRAAFHTWVQQLWQDKDALITRIQREQAR